MNRTCVIFLMIIFSLNAYCQQTLVVEKVGTGKIMYFNGGDYISIKAKNPDTVISGYITAIYGSAIMINGNTYFEISDITAVKKEFHGMKLMANFFGLAGIVWFGVTTVNNTLQHDLIITKENMIITGSLLATAGLFKLFEKKWIRIQGRWRVIVLDRQIKYLH